MPIYEYACADCKKQFELFQKMSDPPPSTCPECGSEHVRKLVSAAAFVLKGGGWYRDHYGLKSGSDASPESSGAGAAASAAAVTPATKTDSAPASAPSAPAVSPSAPSSSGSGGSSSGGSSSSSAGT